MAFEHFATSRHPSNQYDAVVEILLGKCLHQLHSIVTRIFQLLKEHRVAHPQHGTRPPKHAQILWAPAIIQRTACSDHAGVYDSGIVH